MPFKPLGLKMALAALFVFYRVIFRLILSFHGIVVVVNLSGKRYRKDKAESLNSGHPKNHFLKTIFERLKQILLIY